MTSFFSTAAKQTIVIGIFITMFSMQALAKQEEVAEKTPPSVQVATISAEIVEPVFKHVARVEAIDSVDIRARVEGFIEKINFQDGQLIEAGTVIYEIEDDTYLIAVKQKEAELKSAEATLKNAKADLNRKKGLVKRDLISKSDFDSAEANRDTASANVMLSKAKLEQAKLELSYTKIISPISGRIGISAYTVGNLVNPSSNTLVTVKSVDPIYVSIELSEKKLLKAKMSEKSQAELGLRMMSNLVLSDGRDYAVEGHFNFLGSRVDPETDTVKIRATYANPDGLLLPGQFVTMLITLQSEQKKLVVPQVAVQKDSKGFYVLVVNPNNKAVERRIEIGQQTQRDWVVKSGLKEGERVIVQGLQKVKTDTEVNPVEEVK